MITTFLVLGTLSLCCAAVYINRTGEWHLLRRGAELQCVRRGDLAAMFWKGHPPVDTPAKIVDSDDSEPAWQHSGRWRRSKALQNGDGPVFDSRWDDLPTVSTENLEEVKKLAELPEEAKSVHISVYARQNAHILLCDGKQLGPHRNFTALNCTFVVLRGYAKNEDVYQRNIVKYCPAGTLPIKGILRRALTTIGPCTQDIDNSTGHELNEDAWTHLTLSWRDGVFTVGHSDGAGSFLKWKGMPVRIQGVWVRSHETTFWKIHNYAYDETDGEAAKTSDEVRLLDGAACLHVVYRLRKWSSLEVTAGNVTLTAPDVMDDGEWHEARFEGSVAVPRVRFVVRVLGGGALALLRPCHPGGGDTHRILLRGTVPGAYTCALVAEPRTQIVEGKPKASRAATFLKEPLHVKMRTSSSILLSLTSYETTDGVEAWKIRLKYRKNEDNSSEWSELESISSAQNRAPVDFLINNLQPDTEYLVKALVEREDGNIDDAAALVITVRTTCTDREFAIRQGSSRDFIITDTAESSRVSCRLENYEVCLGSNYTCQMVYPLDQLPRSGNNLIVNNLTPYSTYNVTVFHLKRTVLNGTVATPADAPPGVRGLTVYAATEKEAWIRWLKPDPPHGLLKRYDVELFRADEQLNFDQRIRDCVDWPEFTCTSVQAGPFKQPKQYFFQVKAVNDPDFVGNFSKINVIFTRRSSSHPENLTAQATEAGALFISWKHPLIPGAPLEAFEVNVTFNSTRLRPSKASETKVVRAPGKERPLHSITISDLLPSSRYTVTVVPIGEGIGKGNPAVAAASTSDAAPRFRPTDALNIEASDTSLTITLPSAPEFMTDESACFLVVTQLCGLPVAMIELPENVYSKVVIQRATNDIQHSWVAGSVKLHSLRTIFIVGEDSDSADPGTHGGGVLDTVRPRNLRLLPNCRYRVALIAATPATSLSTASYTPLVMSEPLTKETSTTRIASDLNMWTGPLFIYTASGALMLVLAIILGSCWYCRVRKHQKDIKVQLHRLQERERKALEVGRSARDPVTTVNTIAALDPRPGQCQRAVSQTSYLTPIPPENPYEEIQACVNCRKLPCLPSCRGPPTILFGDAKQQGRKMWQEEDNASVGRSSGNSYVSMRPFFGCVSEKSAAKYENLQTGKAALAIELERFNVCERKGKKVMEEPDLYWEHEVAK